MATTRDRREGGRVNVYLSPEAMARLDAAAGKMFPGRQRTDGLVIESALKVLEQWLQHREELLNEHFPGGRAPKAIDADEHMRRFLDRD